ncbi:MAG: YncE family protein [Vicinamibacteria bacterium]
MISRKELFLAVAAATLLLPPLATGEVSPERFARRRAVDPKSSQLHLFGVWPNRLRIFDEATEEFVSEIPLKFGASTNSTHSPDFSKFYFVTDRMEAVEVVDLAKGAVVDTVKLSDQARQVRMGNIAVNPAGTLLYLVATPVVLEIDRFVPAESEIFVYDLENKRLRESFKMPDEVESGHRPSIHFSPDGSSIFLFGRDIYEIRASDNELVDTITLSKPLQAGYGPFRGARLTEEEPGIYYGLYRTQDPFLKKTMMGVLRIDLTKKDVESFELGPDVKVGMFAIASDKKRAYAGLNDLLAIDMETKTVIKRVENFEQGRTNNSLIVSSDGKKLYVGGVGDTIQVYDTETLSLVKSIFAGGDFMATPVAIPRAVALPRAPAAK